MSLKLSAITRPYPKDIKRHVMQGTKVQLAYWVSNYAE